MKLLKPTWVHHDEKPIFSVDVHKECLKFATGGQGNDSGRVVVWNLEPVLSEKAEFDETIPKVLCQMDTHLACVNCVRWSQNGQMLASGSDDKLVMIWCRSEGTSCVFGQKYPESWKCTYTLRGHSGDVLDIAWSPHDYWLASCSVDNTVIIWDCHNFPTMITVLKGHTGLVKGVAWDPINRYLASQSDDRSVKIWKTSDWTCNKTIIEPFEECSGTTHILRLSWSPDGQYLVSAHAMNGGGPTAQIIEREGWKCDKDFVGHRKAVTCVRFHPAILKSLAPKSKKPQQYCCLAVGSRDRSLSVWLTALQRPLVVIHELFTDSILDLSWGPQQSILLACSGDGTIACLQFSEKELGTSLSEEDKNTLYQRIYGKNVVNINNSSTSADDHMVIENIELLQYMQDKVKQPVLPLLPQIINNNNFNCTKKNNSTLSQSASNGFIIENMTVQETAKSQIVDSNNSKINLSAKTISKQVETRRADGRRRITPVTVPMNANITKNDSNTGNNTDQIVANTERKTVIQNESIPTQMTFSSTMNVTRESTPLETKEVASSIIKNISKVNEGSTDAKNSKTRNNGTINEQNQDCLDPRLIKCTSSTSTKHLTQPKPFDPECLQSFPHFRRIPLPDQYSDTSSPIPSTSSKAFQASTAGPKIAMDANSKREFQKCALDYRVHVQNGFVRTANGFLAKVTAFRIVIGKLWETLVGSPVVNFNFCSKCIMLCSFDGTIRLLDMQTGQSIMPIISLTTAAIQCAFSPKGRFVGVLTENGILRIWNIETCTAVLATTCSDIFDKNGVVMQFHVTEQAVPLILFANGHAYSYSPKLLSWLVLYTRDPITRYGVQSSMPREFPKNYLSYPLTSVQATTNAYATQTTDIELNTNDWQTQAKLIFIENQIKLCEIINSPDEYKYWFLMLAFHLAISGNEKQIRLVLNDLLKPTTRHKNENSTIMNISKIELLELVLRQLKIHLKWQRLYMEYNELYEDMKQKEEEQHSIFSRKIDQAETMEIESMDVTLTLPQTNLSAKLEERMSTS